jgi:hypothetical protein
MLFRLLKLFGLDIPTKIEAVKADVAQRVEQASDHIKQVAQQVGVIAALAFIASIAGAFAIAIGLAALYVWVASNYGVYAGLGVVGGILVIAAAVCGILAAVKAKAMSAPTAARAPPLVGVAPVAAVPPDLATVTADPGPAPLSPPVLPPPQTTAADLIEPLAYFLSRYVKFPTAGIPVLDELVADLRSSAKGTAHDALDRAADVVRKGDRANLVVVLSGAAFVGWLLSRQARPPGRS